MVYRCAVIQYVLHMHCATLLMYVYVQFELLTTLVATVAYLYMYACMHSNAVCTYCIRIIGETPTVCYCVWQKTPLIQSLGQIEYVGALSHTATFPTCAGCPVLHQHVSGGTGALKGTFTVETASGALLSSRSEALVHI